MKHKPDIEKLLEHTQVPKVAMDANSKNRILFELLQQPAAQKVTPETHIKKPWWQSIFLPQFLAIGSALAVIVFVAIWVVYSPEDKQLTNANVNTNIDEPIEKNVNTELANTNTNSNENTNKPINTINENPIEVVEKDVADIGNVLSPRLERIDGVASLYLGLGGGHPDLDGLTFHFSRSAIISDASTPRSISTLRTLYDSEIQSFANVFPIDPATSEIDTFGSSNRALMNVVGTITDDQLFGRCVDLFTDPVEAAKIERCVAISEFGRIDLMQSTKVAEANGLDEAFTYITKLTGKAREEYEVINSEIKGATEYDVYYKYSLNEVLPLRDIGWHVTLKEGKLISLIGYIQPLIVDSGITDTISSAEAYDRFVKAYEFQDSTNPHFSRSQTYEYSELVRTFVEIGPTISMNVDEIQLEYMVAETISTTDEDIHTIQLIPVYRIYGHLNTTAEEFTVYIDATRSGDLFSKRFLIYNVGFVR